MIDPIAFTIFGHPIRWYGIYYALGFLISYFFIQHLGKIHRFDKEKLENVFLYFMIFSVLGGRLGEIIFYDIAYYSSNLLQIFAVWKGGMSIHGGIIGGGLTLLYFSRKYKWNFLKLTDMFVIPGAAGLAFGRLANFVNQELVGKVTNSSLGVVFPLYDDQTRWPSTLFESAKNMFTFQVLLYLEYFKELKPGIISAWFLILYSFGRFFVNYFREPQIDFIIFSMGQLLSLIFGIFGLWLLHKISK